MSAERASTKTRVKSATETSRMAERIDFPFRTAGKADPPSDCDICPRLRQFLLEWRAEEPQWFNAPVPSFVDPRGDKAVRLLVIGLAPGLRGANRTSRPFTGDYAGDLLYGTLKKYGFAAGDFAARPDDSLVLRGAAVTNAVRCVPPKNKPVGAEINNCRAFLTETIERFETLAAIVTLGRVAHDTTVRAFGEKLKEHPFGHGKESMIGNGLTLLPSYHCSRYNTNTGVLTPEMFDQVFARASEVAGS